MNATTAARPHASRPALACASTSANAAASTSARRRLAGSGLLAATLVAALAAALATASGSEAAAPAAATPRFVADLPLHAHAAGSAHAAALLQPDAQQQEAGSSNALATRFEADDDHCFVANHAFVNAADGTRHFLQVTFRKRGQGVGVVRFGSDPLGLVEAARLGAPTGRVSVDIAHRRIGFDHAVLSGPGGTWVLDGSYAYATTPHAEDRAACG